MNDVSRIIATAYEALGAVDLSLRPLDSPPSEWHGRVFVQPPYQGRRGNLGAWIRKLIGEYRAGRVTEAIAFIPARTDTRAFGAFYAARVPHVICFIRGRVRFEGERGGAPFPSALVYVGGDGDRMARFFEASGIANSVRRPCYEVQE